MSNKKGKGPPASLLTLLNYKNTYKRCRVTLPNDASYLISSLWLSGDTGLRRAPVNSQLTLISYSPLPAKDHNHDKDDISGITKTIDI